jgi:hypothetical protein
LDVEVYQGGGCLGEDAGGKRERERERERERAEKIGKRGSSSEN